MKILIGVGEQEASAALSLIQRLGFADARLSLLHAVPPVRSWYADPLLADPAAERAERIAEGKARRRLEALAAGDSQISIETRAGKPVEVVLERARRRGADLVAVDASERGALERLFVGSVARSLASAAPQSVLLARPDERTGPVRAVLATDHSAYASACLEKLIAFAPRGLESVTVLTAYPDSPADALGDLASEIAHEALGAASFSVEESCRQVVGRLSGKVGGPETAFTARVSPGRPGDVITRTMKETGSELLILGAQGRGLIRRLTLGSVSFEQAVGAHPYSTLILRA